MPEICRLCLKSTGTFFQNLSVYKQLIQSTIPELNLNLIPTSLICDSCSSSLQKAYTFKTCCLDSEQRIKLLLNGRNGDKYTLDDIINIPEVVVKLEAVCNNIDNEVVQADVDPLADVEIIPRRPLQKNKPPDKSVTNKFRCTMCNADFLLETNFQIHLRGHAGKAYNCDVCYKGFDNKKEFSEHIVDHAKQNSNPEKSTVQTRNEKVSKTKKKRRPQNGVHVGKQVQRFGIGTRYNREFVNNKNMQTNAVVKSTITEDADKDETQVGKEINAGENMTEDEDDEYLDLAGKQQILDFLGNQSESETEQAVVVTNQKQLFECTLCSIKRSTKQQISEHITQHKLGYKNQCVICGDLFSKLSLLYDHLNTQHMPTLCLVKVSDTYIKEKVQSTVRRGKRAGKKPSLTPTKMRKLEESDNFDKLVDVLREELDTKFSCEYCEKSFKISEALAEHLKLHLVEDYVDERRETISWFPCNICGQTFFTTANRDRHMYAHTLYAERSLICQLCQKKFADPNVYQSHMSAHKDNTDKFCKICPLRFLSQAHYDTHMKYQHGTRCNGCEATFSNGDALSLHVKKCNKKFFCKYCDFEARSKQSLQGHWLIHGLPTSKVSCSICDFKTMNRCDLVKHIKSHNEFEDVACKHCNMAFISEKEHSLHQLKHGWEPPRPAEKTFPCKYCSSMFETDIMMKAHKRKCTSKPNCAICYRKFDNDFKLKQHIKRLHNTDFKCYLCEKVHTVKQALTRHMNYHDDVTDLQCDHCPFRFFEEDAYHKHVQTVHMVCSNCNISFDDVTTLNKHMLLCPRLFMVECSYCKYKCLTIVDYKRHIARQHPSTIERKYHCTLCDRRFLTKRDISWHFEQHDIVQDIRCDYCHFRFVSMDHHNQHLVNHTYKCKFCGVEIETKDALSEHIVKCKKNPDYIDEIIIYGKEGKLTCTHCNVVFASMAQLTDHFKMVVLL